MKKPYGISFLVSWSIKCFSFDQDLFDRKDISLPVRIKQKQLNRLSIGIEQSNARQTITRSLESDHTTKVSVRLDKARQLKKMFRENSERLKCFVVDVSEEEILLSGRRFVNRRKVEQIVLI